MYIFLIDLDKTHKPNRIKRFIFPYKVSKKFNTTGIHSFNSLLPFEEDDWGWFKEKNKKKAEYYFITQIDKLIKSNRYEFNLYNGDGGLFENSLKEIKEDYDFLIDLKYKTIEKYGEIYPELFI